MKGIGIYGFTSLSSDFDDDGWPDIYVACDNHGKPSYHNNHDGTFTEIGKTAGVAFNEEGSMQAGMGCPRMISLTMPSRYCHD